MKIHYIYKTAALFLLCILLQGRSGGPAKQGSLQVTGAPGNGTCANTGCHTGGTFNPSLSITLLDGANPVTKYLPGKTYTLRIVNTPAQGTPAGYGFQAVALNATNQQAGDWGAPGSGRQVTTIAGKKYLEHSEPAASGTVEATWIAPAAGTGKVNFFSAGLAANMTGSVAGDATATASLTVEEESVSQAISLENLKFGMAITPNPVSELLNIDIISRMSGTFNVRIMDIAGAVRHIEPVNLRVGQNRISFPVGHLLSGIYIVQLCGETHVAATRMIKY